MVISKIFIEKTAAEFKLKLLITKCRGNFSKKCMIENFYSSNVSLDD